MRPEDLSLADGGEPIFTGRVDIVEHLGELTLLYVDCGYGEPIIAKLDGNVELKRDSEVALAAPAEMLHVFDDKGRLPAHRLTLQPVCATASAACLFWRGAGLFLAPALPRTGIFFSLRYRDWNRRRRRFAATP